MTFGLVFAILAVSFSLGLVDAFWFRLLFIIIIFLLMVDLLVKFILKQHETVYVHKLELAWISTNYDTYRFEQQKEAKEDMEEIIAGLGKDAALQLVSNLTSKLGATKKKKKQKKINSIIDTVQDRITQLEIELE